MGFEPTMINEGFLSKNIKVQVYSGHEKRLVPSRFLGIDQYDQVTSINKFSYAIY